MTLPKKIPSFLVFYLLPVFLFSCIALFIFPYYQYGIISDDISYLSIAQRYLEGDTGTAINGFWSPFNIWLLVLGYKLSGLPLIPLAYLINSISFTGFLILSISLFHKFIFSRFERIAFGIFSAFFWAFQLPVNLFADGLSCLFMMAALLVLCNQRFYNRPLLWILFALISTLAYLSKAYSFYILPFLAALNLILQLQGNGKLNIKSFLTPILTIGFAMLLFSFPWIFVLHQKYGLWTISNAGQVNTNWALKGTQYFDESIGALTPPSYSDGLSCWEDPWIHHGDILKPTQSLHLFLKQILRIGINILKWAVSVSNFSAFYIPLWMGSLVYLFKLRKRIFQFDKSIILLAFLVFPIGYLPLVVADRYFWFTIPLAMLFAVVLLQKFLFPYLNRTLQKLCIVLFFFSWFPSTILELKDTLYEGKAEYVKAQQLKEFGIQGSFISNHYRNYQNHFRISYFANCPYYMYFGERFTTRELLELAHRQQVNYYFYFYEKSGEDYQLKDQNGHLFPELTDGKIQGLKVFELNPVTSLPTINSSLAL